MTAPADPPQDEPAGSPTPALPIPQAFLAALFAPDDLILIRPIETWTQDGKKKSRTVFKNTRYFKARDLVHPTTWGVLLRALEQERAHGFFGTCPRVGGRHDLAWQIRTVRALWADLDDCTPEQAHERCRAAGLPPPSIVVRSGHGVHLYWLLTEPFLITDAGVPPPVRTEFREGPAGKKVPFAWFTDPLTNERVDEYLDDAKRKKNPLWPQVSPQGRHIQHVLAGLAQAIGGDHTQDLARLLRLPGTLNRKDQRQGKTPVPCMLLECAADRRYPLADFERCAAQAPQRLVEEAASQVRLKSGVKLTTARRNKLADFLNACSVAEDRSSADFALCCWAIEQGLVKEEVWSECQGVGKFAQRGRDYFELTWGKAEQHTRCKVYQRACRRAGHPPAAATPGTVHEGGAPTPDAVGPGPPATPSVAADDGDGPGAHEALDDPHRLARFWLQRHAQHRERPRLAYYREEFWRWLGQSWQAVPDAEMRASVAHFCKRQLDRDNQALLETWSGDGDPPRVPKVTRELVSNVLQALGGEVLLGRHLPQPCWLEESGGRPRPYLAVANGLLDVDALLAGASNVLRPHTPRWFSPVCLAYSFDPDATCPRWLAFLERNLGNDSAKTTLLQQFAGYLLLPTTHLQRFLMMVGEGSNGKSVVCAVLRGLLGAENVSSVALEVFGERFHLSETLGKLANVVAEVGELDKVAEGQLKAFVTGDPLLFERKFKAPFTAQPTARLVLATNTPPQFSDKSDGLWRRLLLLQFTVQIPPAERVAGMDSVAFWAEAGELPGILNWALAGLDALRRQGRFEVPAACAADVEALRTDSNPARRFLREHYTLGPGEIATAELYSAYTTWCVQHGHRPLAEIGFGKEVVRAFRGVERRRAGGRAHRFYIYAGLVPQPD